MTLSQQAQTIKQSHLHAVSIEDRIRDLHRTGSTVTTINSATKDSGSAGPLENPLEVWIRNVRLLSGYADENPELMIPHITLLHEQDWLDIARGEFTSEADFKIALGKLRDLARRKAAPEIGHALKAAIKAADGRIPNSPRDLIPYLPVGFNVAILDQMIIDPSGPVDERVPTSRFVLFERPVDALDQPLVFNSMGATAPRAAMIREGTVISK